MFSGMFSALVHHFQLLKQLMHGKHLRLVAAEESIHTPHSSHNVQLPFYIIKSRPICFSKTSHHVFGVCNWASGPEPMLHNAAIQLMHSHHTH